MRLTGKKIFISFIFSKVNILSFCYPGFRYTFDTVNIYKMRGLIITISSKLTLEQNKIFKKLCNEKQVTRSEMIRKILVNHISKIQK